MPYPILVFLFVILTLESDQTTETDEAKIAFD